MRQYISFEIGHWVFFLKYVEIVTNTERQLGTLKMSWEPKGQLRVGSLYVLNKLEPSIMKVTMHWPAAKSGSTQYHRTASTSPLFANNELLWLART